MIKLIKLPCKHPLWVPLRGQSTDVYESSRLLQVEGRRLQELRAQLGQDDVLQASTLFFLDSQRSLGPGTVASALTASKTRAF